MLGCPIRISNNMAIDGILLIIISDVLISVAQYYYLSVYTAHSIN